MCIQQIFGWYGNKIATEKQRKLRRTKKKKKNNKKKERWTFQQNTIRSLDSCVFLFFVFFFLKQKECISVCGLLHHQHLTLYVGKLNFLATAKIKTFLFSIHCFRYMDCNLPSIFPHYA